MSESWYGRIAKVTFGWLLVVETGGLAMMVVFPQLAALLGHFGWPVGKGVAWSLGVLPQAAACAVLMMVVGWGEPSRRTVVFLSLLGVLWLALLGLGRPGYLEEVGDLRFFGWSVFLPALVQSLGITAGFERFPIGYSAMAFVATPAIWGGTLLFWPEATLMMVALAAVLFALSGGMLIGVVGWWRRSSPSPPVS